ncbi:MAG: DUF4340 domain-containing protein [Vicinamibacterales bacterium]
MRGLRSTLVLFLILVGLGSYIYFFETKKPAPGSEPARDKVFQVESDKIASLTIARGSGERSVLQKEGSDWKLSSPVQADADEAEVSSITSGIANLEIQRVVDEEPKDLAQYGLQQPKIEISFKVAGQEGEKQLHLGNKTPTGGDMYARLPNQKRVFLVPGYLESTFDKSAFDLRDKSILVFDRSKAASLELTDGQKRIEMKKEGEEWRVVQPIQARADYGSVEGIVGRLQSAQMKSIVTQEAADLKPYGLDKPSLSATIGLGSARATIELGGKADDGTLYARDTSRPMVFTVESGLGDELRKGVDDFRRKDVFEFRTYNASAIEVARGPETRAYEKAKGSEPDAVEKWRQVKPAAKEIDQPSLESFLSKLANLRAAAFAPAGTKAGMETPVAAFTVRFDEGKKSETVTFGRVGSDVYASRPDEPGFMKIDTAAFEEALKALDEVKPAETKKAESTQPDKK